MLEVKTPEQVLELIGKEFSPIDTGIELVTLDKALGRVLAEDIVGESYVPDFDRSTVDGYAIRSQDSFGCSEAIPAILELKGQVLMGQAPDISIEPYSCAAIPTGGALPQGADCAVMIEYSEDYGDGSVGIMRPAAPGENLIFRGDDVFPGKPLLKAGRLLSSQDIGALAAIGRLQVPVRKRLRLGLISTGDELVEPGAEPEPGQVRDVNSPMLKALLESYGAQVLSYGIIADDETLLRETLCRAAEDCDAVLISGGSSVGVKDAACRIIESMGSLLLHGIAIKPGKPTILGKHGSQPLVGLPGHPVAAWVVTRLFVLPLLARLEGRELRDSSVSAVLKESLSANHGRAQVNACRLAWENGQLTALPIRSKAGLISQLAGADGFIYTPRDREGLAQGELVQVILN